MHLSMFDEESSGNILLDPLLRHEVVVYAVLLAGARVSCCMGDRETKLSWELGHEPLDHYGLAYATRSSDHTSPAPHLRCPPLRCYLSGRHLSNCGLQLLHRCWLILRRHSLKPPLLRKTRKLIRYPVIGIIGLLFEDAPHQNLQVLGQAVPGEIILALDGLRYLPRHLPRRRSLRLVGRCLGKWP